MLCIAITLNTTAWHGVIWAEADVAWDNANYPWDFGVV